MKGHQLIEKANRGGGHDAPRLLRLNFLILHWSDGAAHLPPRHHAQAHPP